MIESRVIRLLPYACLAGGILLFASELTTTFEFTPPGGVPLSSQSGADRHGGALIVLAVFAIGALALAVFTASKPAAFTVAVCGGVALLVFLLGDLPDANAVGTLDDAGNSFFDAEAVPKGGFFLEMVGSLALTITGIALAMMTPEQLAALRPGRPAGSEVEADRGRGAGTSESRRASGRRSDDSAPAAADEAAAADPGEAAKPSHNSDSPQAKRPRSRRSRSRQRG